MAFGLLCRIDRPALGRSLAMVADLFFLVSTGRGLGLNQMIDQDLQDCPNKRYGEQRGEQNEFGSKHASSIAHIGWMAIDARMELKGWRLAIYEQPKRGLRSRLPTSRPVRLLQADLTCLLPTVRRRWICDAVWLATAGSGER